MLPRDSLSLSLSRSPGTQGERASMTIVGMEEHGIAQPPPDQALSASELE